MANAALGACDRGEDGESAWRIYSFMLAHDLRTDSITFKALTSALAKVDQWQRCCAVFVRALDAAVPLEAVSVMVLLFALSRAGRWRIAEAVFLCAYEASCDTTSLLDEVPLAEAAADVLANHGVHGDLPPPRNSILHSQRVHRQAPVRAAVTAHAPHCVQGWPTRIGVVWTTTRLSPLRPPTPTATQAARALARRSTAPLWGPTAPTPTAAAPAAPPLPPLRGWSPRLTRHRWHRALARGPCC